MASYDPADPLALKDPIVAKGAAQYYAEQAEINAAYAWEELQKAHRESEQRIQEIKSKLTPRRLPKTIAKKVWRVADRKAHGRLNRLRYNGVRSFLGVAPRGPLIPPFTDIVFAQPQEPVVSIVIPVYNLLGITLDCLRSLSKIKSPVPFEVIVVDDASPDPLINPVLRRIAGIVYVRQATNGGFVASCNAGAARARGEVIYFLNNDTTVDDDFLAPIVELYRDDPKVGAVGSKLVHPTGLLQEAGGIIFKTGEGWNYGKTDDPNKPAYNFVREADYCSGAGLSIRRALFERIGGFNKNLQPGYYEDVELCFAVHALGYRVLYQPRSVVTHYEGASSSSNATEGKKPMKAYQEVNFHKFKKMRAAELTRQWPKELRYLPLIARRKRGLRIWVFDWVVPMTDRDYGSARMFTLLKLLAREHTVTFVSRDMVDRRQYREALYSIGVDVVPRDFGTSFTALMREQGRFIDLAIVSRPEVMHYFYHVIRRFAPQAPVIYDTVDVHHKRLERERDRVVGPNQRAALTQQIDYFTQLEKTYGQLADVVWAITAADQAIFKKLLPTTPVDVVSAAHAPNDDVPQASERTDLMYVGSFFHPPNKTAIEFYIRELYPRLQRRLPGIRLNVLGQPVPDSLKQLAREKTNDGVIFWGGVSEAVLQEHQRRSRVFVAPLLFGSGLKGKIVMAMAMGLPVVTTTIGSEGIPAKNGRDIDVADDPDVLVDRIVALYQDDSLWTNRSHNARQLIAERYNEANLQRELRDSLARLTAQIGSRRFNHDPIEQIEAELNMAKQT